jgi:uncharacterized protein DUF6920
MRLNGSRIVALTRQGGQFSDPVARYLTHAVVRTRRIIAATIEQKGEIRLGDQGSRWRRFTATEQFTTGRPRFEWHARIHLAPLLNVDARDTYVIGAGSMRATLFGIPIVDQHGRRELNESALQRYLAEAVWFPSALMPGPALTWDVVDACNAVASIRDRKTSTSLLFRVNDDDEVSDILSPARYRATKQGFALTPWAVRCREYFDVDGFRIPRYCEVEWLLPEGPVTYWRGEVTRVRYQLEPISATRVRPRRPERTAPAHRRYIDRVAIPA